MTELKTRWTDKVNCDCPLPEYPRPQLQRKDWQNLNGRFDYAITRMTDEIPLSYDGEIIVPFAPECYLSGVGKTPAEDEYLWYRKKFTLDSCFDEKKVLLHFGAVDYKCKVFINSRLAGEHTGGYVPFTLDITSFIRYEEENELVVQVWDPTDSSWQDRGKQVKQSQGFWYTSTSGIWQTVWLEPVSDIYIKNIKLTPDIDDNSIRIETEFDGDAAVKAIIKDGDSIIFAGVIGKDENVKIKSPKLWSPESPFLYDAVVALCDEDGALIDAVTTYFGMRKFSVNTDINGIPRLFLNNRPYFQNGLLDQGYWSDGGLTAPCDEAMIFDIQSMKDLGFNMLRKHIKVEPHRWYYHCDKIGMLVWQDMVCGANNIDMLLVGVLPNVYLRKIKDNNYKWFGVENEECREEHTKNIFATMDNLYNFPSIACWVPFNEAWGQFDAKRIAEQMKIYDPTRFVDHASGWHDQGGPDFKSVHQYILPVITPKADGRPFVLSEFGGYSRIIENHVWNRKKSFGYVMFKTKETLTKAYKKLFEKQIIPKIRKGLSATVYTQVSDVEFEVNGIYTYDRELLKLDADTVKEINSRMKY